MRTHVNQKGITMIGFVIMLIVVGFFAYAAMRLVPLYTEYFGVAKSMKALQTEPGVETKGIDELRSMMDAQFSIQYVNTMDVPLKNITLITQNGARSLHCAYEVRVPFIYNIDLLVHFEKTVDLSHGGTY